MATVGLSKRDASSRNGTKWLEAKRKASREARSRRLGELTFDDFEAEQRRRGRR